MIDIDKITYNQINHQVRSQLWFQAWDQISTQVRNQIWSQVGNQVDNQVGDQIDEENTRSVDANTSGIPRRLHISARPIEASIFTRFESFGDC